MTDSKKIVAAEIRGGPDFILGSQGKFTDPTPEIWITLEGGEPEKLFSFYSDELSFTAGEFIGLTREEAGRLFTKKDTAYLQS